MKRIRLSDLKEEKVGVVQGIVLCDIEKHKRLIELGFVSYTKVEMLKNDRRAKSVVVGVRGYALALDYTIADGIWVEYYE